VAEDFRLGRGVVDIAADDTGLREDIRAKVKAAGAGQSVTVPIKVDDRGVWRDVSGRLRDARGKFVSEGEKAGSGFVAALRRNLKGKLDFLSKLDFLPGVQPRMLAAAAAAVPLAAGLMSVVSSLGLAATSTAAFIPAALGLAAAFGAVFLAFRDVAGQTPQAVAWSNAVAGMKTEVDQLRRTAQVATLPGFTSMLINVRKLMPDVNNYLHNMGVQASRAADDLGRFTLSPLFRGQLRSIMADNREAAWLFAQSATPIASIVMDIAAAAGQLVPRFAAAWQHGSRMLADWIRIRSETGQLAEYFRRAGDAMGTWWRITRNFLVGIVGLFAAADTQGRSLSATLEEISARFRGWATSERARQQVQGLFELLGRIDVGRILAVASAAGALGLAIKGMVFAQGAAGIVTTLASLGPVGLGVVAAAAAVGVLAAAFGYLYATSAEVRTGVGELLAAVRSNLGPAFERITGFLRGQVVPVLKGGLLAAFRELKGFLIDTLLPALRQYMDAVLPKVEAAWRKITSAFRDNETQLKTLYTWIKTAVTWIVANVLPVMGTWAGIMYTVVGGAISWLVRAIAWVVDAVHAVGAAFTWIGHTTVTVWDAIRSFFAGVMQWIRDAVTATGGAISGAFNRAADAVGGAFARVRAVVVEVAARIWGTVSPLLARIAAVVSFTLNVVRQVFGVVFRWIYEIVAARIDAMRQVITVVWALISNRIQMILDGIRAVVATVWAWIEQVIGARLAAIWSLVVAALTAVRDVITSVLGTIWSGWVFVWGQVANFVAGIWAGIRASTGAALDVLRGIVSGALTAIGGFFSSMWSGIRDGWNAAWAWLHNAASAGIDRLKAVFSSIKDHAMAVFRALPRAIVEGINAMIGLVNSMIGTVNKILPRSLEIPRLGAVSVPQGFAEGGRIRGPGTGTSDSIPIMASDGEFMINAASTGRLAADFGAGFLDWLNSYRGVTVSGDPSMARVRPGYADGGLITRTQAWIHAQDPKPYVLGANGPGAWDCSSLVGGVQAMLTGRDPNRRYYTTYTLPGAGGFAPGRGLFSIGLSREHVVGNLAGLAFEAANSRDGILVGPSATSVDRMPAVYHLPEMGGGFVPGGSGVGGFSLTALVGRVIDDALGPLRARLPRPGGIADSLVTGLFDKAVGGLKRLEFDDGGVLPPGPTLAVNRTGRPEPVLSPEQMDRLAAGAGGEHWHFAAGSIVLDTSKIKDVDELLRVIRALTSTARRHGAKAVTR
jgi:hypothetical protein